MDVLIAEFSLAIEYCTYGSMNVGSPGGPAPFGRILYRLPLVAFFILANLFFLLYIRRNLLLNVDQVISVYCSDNSRSTVQTRRNMQC